ncbi:unnamed protein product [Linum tenue]|uniref:F-box domain-containing protein n=2 Tax=Linum tenue TaxID=586396 RepID=A0AAV0IN26_9ROSI|nr:unnamed protein product [Linum tenue]
METRSKRLRRLSEVNHIDKLGDDLLADILIRCLPCPRSACRCKTVCRRWRSLISSPSFNLGFVSYHQSRNESPPLQLHTHDPQLIISFMPRLEFRVHFNLKVLDCFKDLLLCGFMALDYNNPELSRTFVVCNPFTEQWLALPIAPKKLRPYAGSTARLVCEPRISYNLDLGDYQSFVYSEYRFRVVILYQNENSIKLDVFCSESGEWTGEAIVIDGVKLLSMNVVSFHGEMFWMYARALKVDDGLYNRLLAVFNPFRLDIPPTSIDTSTLFESSRWDISVSQDALHVTAFRENPDPPPGCSWVVSSVWRLERDRKSWTKVFEGLLKAPRSKCGPLKGPFLGLHPEKMEIAFFECTTENPVAVFSCDLRTGELEFVAELKLFLPRFMVFLPRFLCWPTPVPRYKELRGRYNGTHSCLTQSTEATTSPGTGNLFCQKLPFLFRVCVSFR